VADGVPALRRTALPGPGGVGDQDARDFEALELMGAVWTRVMAERMARRRHDAQVAHWRADRFDRLKAGRL
jgi:hypothetical protein